MKVKDWPIEKAKEEYHKAWRELSLLKQEEKLIRKQRERKYYLESRIDLLRALHLGNPDNKVICRACQNKLVAGYIGNGVVLNELCFYCHSTGGSKEILRSQSRFDNESKKRSARS